MSRTYTLHTHAVPSGIDYAKELNEQQLAAVQSPPGPSLVIAGAGSGKTRTLTFRVAWLLEQGVPPSSILLLTFTNKAAREMLERVAAIAPAGADEIWGGTFHSIGNRILRRHAESIGFRPGFSIMDREDQEDMIEAVVAREGLRTEDRRFPKGSVLAEIFGLAINCGLQIPGVLAERYPYFLPLEAQIERIAVAYEGRKKSANSMDFDDLLAKTLELFTVDESVAERYQRQFQHVLVDEYQDTNRLQAELVDRIAMRHGNVMVVGDDAQSIYSWRGANFENILRFPDKHPGAQVYKIETNYRSVPEVLELANAAILGNERQFRKELRAVRSATGSRPALVPLATNNAQAAFVAQRILELNEEGVDFREIAVLYRAHYQSLEVQLEFTRRDIPFSITSGLRFFEQAHIKDVAAFMKFSVNPNDEVAFKRMVKLLPGIGAKSAETLWTKTSSTLAAGKAITEVLSGYKAPAKSEKSLTQLLLTLSELRAGTTPVPPATMIESVLFAVYDDYMRNKFANYDARREDLNTLQNYAKQFPSAEEFLAQLALLGGIETTEALAANRDDDDKVTLSSVHQAKGLEWRAVFVVWLTDGMFPTSRSLERDEDVEEERRLFYVAVTRCKDELYLTYPELRLNAGYGEAFQRPSRFLKELPENLYEEWEVQSTSGPYFNRPAALPDESGEEDPW
ncbi:MAG TPA: ATP-dependent helicase [Chthoniobacterales bacterium]|nr:ATP-dependent helicase [Chthoniobacterales bacterium]